MEIISFETREETNEVLSVRTIYEEDGETIKTVIKEHYEFITPVVVPPTPPEITMQDIKENQLILMGAIADLFETLIGGS